MVEVGPLKYWGPWKHGRRHGKGVERIMIGTEPVECISVCHQVCIDLHWSVMQKPLLTFHVIDHLFTVVPSGGLDTEDGGDSPAKEGGRSDQRGRQGSR